MNLSELATTAASWCMSTGIKVVIAIVILIVAFLVINAISKKLLKMNEEKAKLDKTVARALISAGRILAKVLVVICLINYLGIDTSGITALIASLGVCLGLAVNGALANIAGGVLLLITRPFKVDDYIEVAGNAGTVEEINICATKIITVDNKVVYVPNGTASTATVINYSEKAVRRVDLVYTIPYTEDFEKAKAVIAATAEKEALVLKDPALMCRVTGSNKNGNEVTCRAWVKTEDYWSAYFNLLEATKTALGANGFTVPGEQVEVHIAK